MDTTSTVNLLKNVTRILRDIQHTQFSEIASSTIILYDHLITIPDEIEYIWKRPWTLGKTLFIISRYYAIGVVIFNNYALFTTNLSDNVPVSFIASAINCESLSIQTGESWLRWQGWTGFIVTMIAEIVLQLRLYALYHRDKRILALLVTAYITASTTAGVVMGTTLADLEVTSHIIPGRPVCVPLNISTHFWAFWIPLLAFETLMCSLAIFRGFQSYKRREILNGGATPGSHLLQVLIRDSILYFIVMFATYLTTTIIWIMGPTTVIEIPVGFVVALSCVMGNRLLLNIRDSIATDDYEIPMHPVTSIGWQFQSTEIRLADTDKLGHHELITLRSMHAKA